MRGYVKVGGLLRPLGVESPTVSSGRSALDRYLSVS
jgi:hypothetical protein